MKRLLLSTVLFITFIFSCLGCTFSTKKTSESDLTQTKVSVQKPKIQVAILLDTSSSMDGLINQAKSRLWTIVNTLTTLKYQGKTPRIEIALYEYGNNNIDEKNDYIKQVTPLTTDLDLISEMLFGLSTYGGYEYCGAVIDRATKQLEWGSDDADMKLIYIAGNEPFAQGELSYQQAIKNALNKNIYINTIHCGNRNEGIQGKWQEGATLGKGKFFNIDHNAALRHIDTPYDARIAECNLKLNDTYIGYGSIGASKKMNQVAQDTNANELSETVYAERVISKSKSAYDNSSWDMVDQVKKDKQFINKLEKKDLPKELQGKTAAEIQIIVEEKSVERTKIQKEITKLAEQRQDFIDKKMKEDDGADDLGNAITSSVLSFAEAKGYKVSK